MRLAPWIAFAACAACTESPEGAPGPKAGFGGAAALGAVGGSAGSGNSAKGGADSMGGTAGSDGGGTAGLAAAGFGGTAGKGESPAGGGGGAGGKSSGGTAGALAGAGSGGAGPAAGTGGQVAGAAGEASGGMSGAGSGACREDADLTVMTFNIRYDSGSGGGEDAWNARVNPRRERVLATIRDSNADLIGVQEALSNQVDDLTSALTDFAFFGVGRDDGRMAGEYAGIFYRSSRFELVDGAHFWLSPTPEVPGTVFEGSGSIRMASWVLLHDREAGRDFLLLDTHWDNVSQSSREQSAALIRDRLGTLHPGEARVLTGDLNQAASNVAVRTLTLPAPEGAGLIDGYRSVHPAEAPDEATFHDFTGETAGDRIDFVLHDAAFTASSAAIDRSEFEGRFASDHFAVAVTLGWRHDAAGAECPRDARRTGM